MHRFSLFTQVRNRFLLPGVLAVCAAAACPAATSPPALTGVPPTSVAVGSTYSFQPGSDDTQNKPILGWAIHNLPAWATFNIKTGLLTGKPTSAQVGTYSNIQIFGSDGTAWATTSVFSITVSGTSTSSTGTATLGWAAPTENTNGTALTDLAGYRLHYGTSASNLSTTVQVPGASVKSYSLNNLAAATYYFGITAYTTTGVESAMSQVVSKAVN